MSMTDEQIAGRLNAIRYSPSKDDAGFLLAHIDGLNLRISDLKRTLEAVTLEVNRLRQKVACSDWLTANDFGAGVLIPAAEAFEAGARSAGTADAEIKEALKTFDDSQFETVEQVFCAGYQLGK